MSIVKTDTFTEGADVSLAAHTADVGGGWTLHAGAMLVNAASDYVHDNNVGAGNRFNMTTALAVLEYDVSADISIITNAGFRGAGVMGRNSAAANNNAYNFFYSCTDAAWTLEDGVAATITFAEAWPGNPRTLRLQIRAGSGAGSKKGFVNGTEKVSSLAGSDTNPATGLYAGLVLFNFAGGSVNSLRADNFSVDTADVVGGLFDPQRFVVLGYEDWRPQRAKFSPATIGTPALNTFPRTPVQGLEQWRALQQWKPQRAKGMAAAPYLGTPSRFAPIPAWRAAMLGVVRASWAPAVSQFAYAPPSLMPLPPDAGGSSPAPEDVADQPEAFYRRRRRIGRKT